MLRLTSERRLIPVVGHDLLRIREDGGQAPLYQTLARRLGETFGSPSTGLPRDEELHAVVKDLYARGIEAPAIYRELRRSLADIGSWPTPKALTELAQIRAFKLYVTTTFEGLLARAVDEERFEGRRHTLLFSYAPADKQDLPQEFDRLDRPAVFHLLGRLASTPGSYAITDQDRREFLLSLESKTEDVPYFLLDKLRTSDLLILGSRAADWLTRFFVRHTAGGQVIESNGSARTSAPVVLLQHFSGGVRITQEEDANAFVSELHRRWTTSASGADADGTADSSTPAAVRGPAGAVFLSYAACDRGAALSLRDELDASGVDVVTYLDDAPGTRDDTGARRQLSESAVFVPVLSTAALGAERSFFRAEWRDAIEDARTIAGPRRFVVPVVLDENTPLARALPDPLTSIEPVILADGIPDAAFVRAIVSLQRRFRSASYA